MRSPSSSRTIRARGGGGTSTGAAAAGAQYLRGNGDPRPVATLLIASLLVVTVAARPRLTLGSNGSASDPADNGADGGPAPAPQCPANNPPSDPAKDCATHRVLCGRILHRRGNGN